jgi:phage gpG-like protein
MIVASLQWHQGQNAIKHLERLQLATSVKDPQILREIQQVIYQSTATNFASKGRPLWRERSESYKRWAMRTYKTFWPPLLRTGTLFRTTLASISRPWKRKENSNILEIWSAWYGQYHQQTSRTRSRKLPRRPYILVQPDEKREIRALIRKSIREA